MAVLISTNAWLLILSLVASNDAQMFGKWPIIKTSTGPIRGHVNGTRFQPACAVFPATRILPVPARPNVATFLGVPYAEAPIGDRRWRPPVAKKPWDKILEAKEPGPVCAQLPVSGLIKIDPSKWHTPEEDCLTLNIWAPANGDGSVGGGKRPIVIYFHGGGYVGGSGYTQLNCAFYDGEGLAHDMDAVVVTLNYRVGVFGFLADPGLREESGTTGNYGLQDQRAAIEWVRKNAEVLGGDVNRITIMGESAGGASVYHHLAIPRSQKLFNQAVALSGYEVTWSLDDAYDRSGKIISSVGCSPNQDRLQCLRNASMMQLLHAEEALVFGPGFDLYKRMFSFGPVSDGFELSENASLLQELDAAGSTKSVLLGSNLNESNLFYCLDKLASNLSQDEAKQGMLDRAKFMFPKSTMSAADVEAIMDQYLKSETPQTATMEFSSDVLFTCTADKVSRVLTKSGANVYRYLFARSPAPFRLDSCLGVPHMAELMYIFIAAFPDQMVNAFVGGATDQDLSKKIISALGRFVREGSPGADWPAWGDNEPTMQLGDAGSSNFTQLNGYRSGICREIQDRILDTPQATVKLSTQDTIVI